MLLFVDMDGVIADFDRGIREMYGCDMSEMTPMMKQDFWNNYCVRNHFFAFLQPIPEGVELLEALITSRLPFTILTSTGGGMNHYEIARQKLMFLSRHFQSHVTKMSVSFVAGTKDKAKYALNNLLIDDREQVLSEWRSSGGQGWIFERSNTQTIIKDVLEAFDI